VFEDGLYNMVTTQALPMLGCPQLAETHCTITIIGGNQNLAHTLQLNRLSQGLMVHENSKRRDHL
jgi:hypothetical protein